MPGFLQQTRQTLLHKVGLLLLTTLLWQPFAHLTAANEPSSSRRRPFSETLQEWAGQVTAVRDAHSSTLSVLEATPDLPAGFRGLRKDMATLSKRLPVEAALGKLAEEARNIARQIAETLPEGRVEAELASSLDREVLATIRRADRLQTEISALRKDLQETTAQLEKWQNAYYAFDFDPQRQDQIIRRLVARRRESLAQEMPLPRIPLDPENESDLNIAQVLLPAPTEAPTIETSEESPPSNEEQIRRPLAPFSPAEMSPTDVLASALEKAVTRPEDVEAQAALNAACFSHLEQFGPRLLASTFNAKDTLSDHLLAHLESAARQKSPAAQQLLGMMHLTGRGRGINYPRGVAYLRAASTQLRIKPAEPYGPGVTPEQAASCLPTVGTALFWLAESLLLGLMEQQPEAAADCYKQAVTVGDPLARSRIRQLTSASTATTSTRQMMNSRLTGLVELHQVDLSALESQLVLAHSVAAGKETSQPVAVVAPSDETLRPFTGLKLASSASAGLGALITSVTPASPAHRAGLQRGDLIVAVNTQSTSSPESFDSILEQTAAGEILELRFLRSGGVSAQARLVLGTITAVTDDVSAVLDPLPMQTRWNPTGVGFQIVSIKPGSLPAAAGLRPGDIVVGANDQPVRHWNEFAAALNPPQGMTTLIVQRHSTSGQPELLSVELLRR